MLNNIHNCGFYISCFYPLLVKITIKPSSGKLESMMHSKTYMLSASTFHKYAHTKVINMFEHHWIVDWGSIRDHSEIMTMRGNMWFLGQWVPRFVPKWNGKSFFGQHMTKNSLYSISLNMTCTVRGFQYIWNYGWEEVQCGIWPTPPPTINLSVSLWVRKPCKTLANTFRIMESLRLTRASEEIRKCVLSIRLKL